MTVLAFLQYILAAIALIGAACLISYLVTLAIGLWVCLTYANPPWPVTRPQSNHSETAGDGQ